MTEAEWLICTDPFQMLAHVREGATFRMRQLYCLACWHEIRPILTDQRSMQALALLERFADHDWLIWQERRWHTTNTGREFLDAYIAVQFALSRRFWDRCSPEDDDEQLYGAFAAETEATLTSWDTGSVQAGTTLTVVEVAFYGDFYWSPCGLYGPYPTPTELGSRLVGNAIMAGPAVAALCQQQRRYHANLVREVFGNPFVQ